MQDPNETDSPPILNIPDPDDAYQYILDLAEDAALDGFKWAANFGISEILKLFGIGQDPDTALLKKIITNQEAIYAEIKQLKALIEWEDLVQDIFAPKEHLINWLQELIAIGSIKSKQARTANIKKLCTAILDDTNGATYDLVLINSLILSGNSLQQEDGTQQNKRGLIQALVELTFDSPKQWTKQSPGGAYQDGLKTLQGLYYLQFLGLTLLVSAHLASQPATPNLALHWLKKISANLVLQQKSLTQAIPDFWRALGMFLESKNGVMKVAIKSIYPINFGGPPLPYLCINDKLITDSTVLAYCTEKYIWHLSKTESGEHVQITSPDGRIPDCGLWYVPNEVDSVQPTNSDGFSANAWIIYPFTIDKPDFQNLYLLCANNDLTQFLRPINDIQFQSYVGFVPGDGDASDFTVQFEVQEEIINPTIPGRLVNWSDNFSGYPKGIGMWKPNFKVRYAYAFVSDYGVSAISPWVTIAPDRGEIDAQSYISNSQDIFGQLKLPTNPVGLPYGYKIYRQFKGKKLEDVTAKGDFVSEEDGTLFVDQAT
ncbi:MAG: hypothetical protein ACRBHB_14960 [Arenicella sp.]